VLYFACYIVQCYCISFCFVGLDRVCLWNTMAKYGRRARRKTLLRALPSDSSYKRTLPMCHVLPKKPVHLPLFQYYGSLNLVVSDVVLSIFIACSHDCTPHVTYSCISSDRSSVYPPALRYCITTDG